MATKMQDAVKKIKDLRDKAKDESLPQDVRNKFLDKANAIELGTYKPTMAKGGAVAMPSQAKMPMAKGGAVKTARSPVLSVMIGVTDVAPKKAKKAKK